MIVSTFCDSTSPRSDANTPGCTTAMLPHARQLLEAGQSVDLIAAPPEAGSSLGSFSSAGTKKLGYMAFTLAISPFHSPAITSVLASFSNGV